MLPSAIQEKETKAGRPIDILQVITRPLDLLRGIFFLTFQHVLVAAANVYIPNSKKALVVNGQKATRQSHHESQTEEPVLNKTFRDTATNGVGDGPATCVPHICK